MIFRLLVSTLIVAAVLSAAPASLMNGTQTGAHAAQTGHPDQSPFGALANPSTPASIFSDGPSFARIPSPLLSSPAIELDFQQVSGIEDFIEAEPERTAATTADDQGQLADTFQLRGALTPESYSITLKRRVDASQGTRADPLLARDWDLTSAQVVRTRRN